MRAKVWRLNERGAILLLSYMIVVVMMILGGALVLLNVNERRFSELYRTKKQALYIAEAGMERALADLRDDFINDSTPSWSDSDINGYAIGPDDTTYYAIPYASTTLNGGSYTVELKNVTGKTDHLWVRATGTRNNQSVQLLAYLKMKNVSPWNNAIFAGGGSAGAMVNGNVNIFGSVHILGETLAPTDLAIDLGGTAELVGNNYSQLEAGLKSKVPVLPTVSVGGETVETLQAELRVKNGLVGLSGNSTVGATNQTGNTYKETVDGVYVTDGWGGNKGTSSVYSDNGWSNSYDLGNSVSFPSLSDPYSGYSSYTAYLKDNGLVISDSATLDAFANLTPGSSFSVVDAVNGHEFTIDGSGNITVSGVVFLDNTLFPTKGDLGMSGGSFTYTGTGVLYVSGDAQIDASLVTNGNNSFPNNIFGVMTPNNMGFNAAGINVMGLFYAEDTITVQKQTDLVGTIVSNFFDLGTNVPSVFQVPDTINNLPAGMIGQSGAWQMQVVSWQKIS